MKLNNKLKTREFLEATILGIAGLIAFTIIAIIVYFIGLGLNVRSLRGGFVAEVLLIWDFPLFFVLVAIIKILIGGEIIDTVTRLLSRVFGVKILVERRKPEE